AIRIVQPARRFAPVPVKGVVQTAVAMLALFIAAPASAQDTREYLMAADRAEKAARLHPYEPSSLEERLMRVEAGVDLFTNAPFYPYIGSTFEGGGVAFGPAYRAR